MGELPEGVTIEQVAAAQWWVEWGVRLTYSDGQVADIWLGGPRYRSLVG